MSHVATTWAIKAVMGRGLLPAQKLLLWHLADRHNPDYGCFPHVSRLAQDLERSRASVMVDLRTLEAVGLIRREPRKCPKTGRQMTTRYILGFEEGFEAVKAGPCTGDDASGDDCEQGGPGPEVGHGDEAPKSADPGPVSAQVRVQNPAKVRVQPAGHITCKKRTSKLCSSAAADTQLADAFERFWTAHPRPRNRDGTRRLFEEAVSGGEDAEALIRAAAAYSAEQAGNRPMYVCQSDNWLSLGRWKDHPGAAAAPGVASEDAGSREAEAARFWAGKVKAGAFIPPNAISPRIADRMLGLGLVRDSDLRRAGVRA